MNRGADIDSSAAALILLLAACEKASEELDRTGVPVDGLAEEIKVLSVRLHDVLGERRP